MPMITTLSELTEWEQSSTLDDRSGDVRRASGRLDDAVADVERDWQAVADCYEGDQEAALLAGFDDARTLTRDLARTASDMDRIMGEFTGTLTTLRSRRSECERDIRAFNSSYGATPLGELEPTVLDRYERLRALPRTLQGEYEDAVRTCVSGLEGLGGPGGRLSRQAMAALNAWNAPWAQGGWSLGLGLASGFSTYQVTHARSGSPVRRGPGVRQHMFLGHDVTRPLGRASLAGPFLGAAGRTGFNAAHALSLSTAATLTTLRHGGWRGGLRNAAGLWRSTSLEALRARGGVTAPLRAVRGSWDAMRGLAPTAGVRTAMMSRGLMAGSTKGLSRTQTQRAMQGMGSRWGQFGSRFVDGLPVVGDVKHFVNTRSTDHKIGQVTAKESTATRNVARGVRGLGAAGNVVSAGLTFADERTKAMEDVRASGEFAGDAEGAKREADIRAGAQTVGNVGSSILASAAVGAAAGSVVPGPGNVVGLVAGVAAGVAMNVGIADTDGDGKKDSLAEMAGDGVEGLVNWVRGK